MGQMRIAVFPNVDKPNAGAVLDRIFRFFSERDVQLMLPMDEARFFGCAETYGVENIEQAPADMALSLGGDGTLLGVCHRYGRNEVPVCGINIGTLGFMADIELDELEDRLEKILVGGYYIEQRLLLAGFVKSNGRERFLGNAINDVVVTKGGMARMLRLGLSINETHLMDYKADGIIVASPTGSTAYSLSAGGPIMNPTIQALLVTPICAHTFNMRPLVVNEHDVIHIHIAAVHQDILVTFDGQESFHLLPGDEVVVRKAQQSARIVKFEDQDYYRILRTKLWN
ncbi:NAD(+)/NADH kinase [Selenomonas bovis]|uniref:NAD(+)/NADH kinase n=1 Tax=Selenomonas bovis TaxID=416586 RepID=UPI0004E17CC2|nr:NAD(+)/NADH kinase [Selenomonas bovis]MCI6171981.1 NAD(+)/NADH kinase [Selenomonas bovis]MCI6753245.1 NAD(+)/NADH kinase [Selenomonas bovis]